MLCICCAALGTLFLLSWLSWDIPTYSGHTSENNIIPLPSQNWFLLSTGQASYSQILRWTQLSLSQSPRFYNVGSSEVLTYISSIDSSEMFPSNRRQGRHRKDCGVFCQLPARPLSQGFYLKIFPKNILSAVDPINYWLEGLIIIHVKWYVRVPHCTMDIQPQYRNSFLSFSWNVLRSMWEIHLISGHVRIYIRYLVTDCAGSLAYNVPPSFW